MECLAMMRVRDKHGNTHVVPCGKCAFCLTNKRSSWMFRVHQEMKYQMHPGYFLTLTYSPKYVKRVGPDGRLSLRFRDVQLFLKQIRKRKYYVKYICVGEYGTETHRPHYHMLIWTDCPAEKLESLWFRGHIQFGTLTMASAMYCLKYIIQPKQKQEGDLEKTRAQFSKGIGLQYLSIAMYEYHTEDYENPKMFSIVDGTKVALPRYYKSKIFTKYQMQKQCHKTKWDSIKERRKLMRKLLAQGIKSTSQYIQKIRTLEANAILKNVKYNTTL